MKERTGNVGRATARGKRGKTTSKARSVGLALWSRANTKNSSCKDSENGKELHSQGVKESRVLTKSEEVTSGRECSAVEGQPEE